MCHQKCQPEAYDLQISKLINHPWLLNQEKLLRDEVVLTWLTVWGNTHA